MRGEETTLIDPVGEEITLAELAAASGEDGSSSGFADAGSSSESAGSGGSGFSSRPQMIEGFRSKVEKPFGAGGMGSVYLCQQSSPAFTSNLGPEEIDPRKMCADAKKLLAKIYDAMIESEPDADWAVRRDIRFGS